VGERERGNVTMRECKRAKKAERVFVNETENERERERERRTERE
jgi:hypothetical protein